MERRQQLENIVIGTLLESTEYHNYYDEVKSSVVPEMFQNETNRRIFRLIAEMNAKGKADTTPCDIFNEYGESVVDIAADMCDLCTDFSFIHLKMDYNERHFLASVMFGVEQMKTDVQFEDYVNQFIKFALSDEKSKN